MTSLSYRMAKALATGRKTRWRPASREEVLRRLLVKRAEAHRAGLKQLEASLRQQISWSLPIHREVERPEEEPKG